MPRFNHRHLNGRELTIDSEHTHLGDARHYIAYTEFFRGDPLTYELKQPFTYRPLTPFLASLLPFEPMTAINVINIGLLMITLAFLIAILQTLGYGTGYTALGGILFVCSFPTFYYGTMGYVEPGVLCMLSAGMYGIERRHWGIFLGAAILGILAKETIVLLLPVLVTALMTTPSQRTQHALFVAAFLLIYGIGTILIRTYAPGDGSYFWSPGWNNLFLNVTRLNAWLSALLSMGLPTMLFVLGIGLYGRERLFQHRLWRYRNYIAGAMTPFALYAYAIIAAYADGRYVWLSYPFMIPLALAVIRYRNERSGIRRPASDISLDFMPQPKKTVDPEEKYNILHA